MNAPGGQLSWFDEDKAGVKRAYRDDLEYARFVAELRVLETRLLTRNQLLRMVDAPDADAAFRLLAETEYGPAVAEAGVVANYELALATELARVFRLLKSGAPEPQLVELLGIAYDWQNLKVALKAALTGKAAERGHLVAAGNLPLGQVHAIAGGGPLVELPDPYREPAVRAAEAYAVTGDPQQVDLILDAARFPSMVERANAWRYGLFGEVSQATADLVNMRTLLRLQIQRAPLATLQRALVPGGRIPTERIEAVYTLDPEDAAQALSGQPNGDVFVAGVQGWRASRSLAVYEKLMDDRLNRLAAGAKYIALGPEPVIAYLMAKETEIKNLRIIFTGKINRLPENTIRERLRETYA